jgi:molecular chaperone DnaK (HSP70)
MAALGVDVGSSKLVSATLPLGEEGGQQHGRLPVLVRNRLSNDATPLAIVFQAGNRRELGEAAIDTPASNADNLVAAFVPRLGAPGEQGACRIPPAGAAQDAQVLRLEQVLAMLLGGQARNLEAQTGVQSPSHLVLAVPPALAAQPGGAAAVRSAALIAGLDSVRLTTSTAALAWHYAERHGRDIAEADGRDIAEAYAERHGRDIAEADVPRTVLIVDVGHMACSAVVARYTPRGGSQEILLEILAEGGSFEAGGGVFDAILGKHLQEKLEKEHGADACGGAKFLFRLNKACEKLKKLLSTVDPAKLDLDSLIPDKDCRLTVARKEWDAMLQPSLEKLKELVARVLAESGVAADGIEGVEAVGGGARVPCVQDALLASTGKPSLRHTLDSSAACGLGAAGIARTLVQPSAPPPAQEEGAKGQGKAATFPVITLSQAPWVECGEEGMGEEELREARALEGRFVEVEQAERERGAASNALETFVYAMRGALTGRHKEHLDAAHVTAACDAIEVSWGLLPNP